MRRQGLASPTFRLVCWVSKSCSTPPHQAYGVHTLYSIKHSHTLIEIVSPLHNSVPAFSFCCFSLLLDSRALESWPASSAQPS